jgi:peptidoglycan/LPS O-acetylase OafA/YrhL
LQVSSDASSRRTDIDLLRAVAVLAVIFFHFEVPGFKGGFLGVDIFFVISGYLITLHIQQQLSNSSFSFLYFYVRRIRRLFPALIATLVLSSIAALIILPKALLLDYSHSQIASSIYLSNVYFWSIADYFDTESILKPLLHTWSLSVEEQFYLVWPLFLVLTFSKSPKVAIGIAAAFSLLAAEFTFNVSASSVFYLFPFRIFEFAIGALMCGRSLKTLPGPVSNILLFVSCLSIALSLYFVSKHTRNPGLLTVPICLGTAIIIGLSHPWLNGNNKATTIFLRFGLISYSAYLVHWPLLVFYKIYNPGPLSFSAILALMSVTYLLAEIFYIFIEKPTSKISIWDRKLLFLSSLPLVLLWAVTFDRLQPRVYRALNPQEYTVAHVLDSIPDRRLVLKEIEKEINEENALATLEKQRKIVVVGDSHAVDVLLSLQLLLAKTTNEVELAHSICDPLTLFLWRSFTKVLHRRKQGIRNIVKHFMRTTLKI